MSGTSRRELLVGAGLLGAAGIGLRAGPVASAPPSTSTAPTPVPQPTVLLSRDVVIRRPGTRPGTRPEPGAAALPQGTLESEDGRVVGLFYTARLESGARPMHLQRFDFGTATLVGVGDSPHEGEFVLIGATGGLSAAGSYLIERDHQGDYRFTFNPTTEA